MQPVEKKRIWIFLSFAFGLAWLEALLLYFNGGLSDSPIIIPQLNLTLAGVVLALGVMWTPGLANVFTRLVSKEGWEELLLRPAANHKAWVYWLVAWFIPGIATILGAAIFFGLFPEYFDAELTGFQTLLTAQGVPEVTAKMATTVALAQTLQAFLLAPLLNSFFTFGEEFGWRGYLLPKLMPLGGRKAALLSGVIWGIWHWPLIAMGHNYGSNYAGYPWLGLLGMLIFCIILGVIFSWLSLKEGSVWPAVIAHAAINGIAALGMLAVRGQPNPLLGPTPVGLVGGIVFIMLAMSLLLTKSSLQRGKKIERWKSEPLPPD